MADRIVVMNHGVVEQIGTPEEIYSEPASAFVADFIGTMNFAPAEIAAPGRVRVGSVELEADEADLPAGTPVTLAIRPEDIIAPAEAAPAEERIGGNVVPATLGDFEFLGYFVRADLSLPGLPEGALRCDLSHNRIRRLGMHAGQAVQVAFPVRRLRVYPRSPGEAA